MPRAILRHWTCGGDLLRHRFRLTRLSSAGLARRMGGKFSSTVYAFPACFMTVLGWPRIGGADLFER